MEDDFALIDLVQKVRYIYDKKTAQFKSKLARKNAWHTIGKILNRDPEECESRWSILRNRYSNEKRKIRKGFPDVIDKNIENTEWFQKMNFLDGFIIPRQSYKHLRRSQNFSYKKPDEDDLSQQNFIEENETDSPTNPKTEENGMDLTKPPSPTSICLNLSSTNRKRPHTSSNFEEILQETLTNLLNYLKQRQKDIENDPDLQFGKTVALLLKDLPPERKKAKQKQIMDFILE